jgi:hypothetical protein
MPEAEGFARSLDDPDRLLERAENEQVEVASLKLP